MKLSEKILNRALGGGLVVGLVAVSVLLVQGQMQRAEQVPSHQEWEDFRTQTDDHLTAGDLIRIVPTWDNLGRTAFRGAVADSETWPFRALDWREPRDPVAWMGFRRLVVVGWKAYVSKERQRLREVGTGWKTLVDSRRLTAQVVELPASPIRWNAREPFISGQVQVERVDRATKNQRCRQSSERRDTFICGLGTATRLSKQPISDMVQLRMVDVGDVPRECVFFEPSRNHPTYQITFTAVPLNEGDTVLLRAGNALRDDTRYGPARRPIPGRVTVELSIDGENVVRDDFHPHDNLWIPWAVDVVTSAKGPKTHQITVRATGPPSGGRQLCFDLYVMGPGWEDWGPVGYGHRYGDPPSTVSVRRQSVSLSGPSRKD